MGNVESKNFAKILPMEAEVLEPPSSTCGFCKNFFGDVTAYDPPQAQTTVSNLLLRAERCRFCKALCGIVEIADPTYLKSHPDAYAVLNNELIAASRSARRMIFLLGITEYDHNRFLLFTPKHAAGLGPINQLFPVLTSIEHSAGSPSLLSLGRSWLQSCLEQHTECRAAEAIEMPKRLVQIIARFQEGFTLRIIPGSVTASPYVALSHSWGKEQNVKTLISNLSTFERDLPWKDLPQTFKDAIIATESLGYTYLWIDSLCIIQDSLEDWTEEAAKMASIYEKAIVTIAAASAAADQEGFLTPRRLSGEVQVENSDIRIGFMRPGYWHRQDVFGNLADPTLDPSSSRAWIFQERVLASRTLYFGLHGLQWQCRSESKCECEAEDLSGLCQFFPRLKLTLERGDEPKAYALWGSEIVEQYTRRLLTYEKDKLVALSGIASRMHSILNDTYIAGLWKKQLAAELLWEHRRVTSSRLPLEYRAPSFSWASIDQAVSQKGHLHKVVEASAAFEMIDVASAPSTSNRFGQVSDGWLTIRASILRAWVYLKLQDLRYPLVVAEEQPTSTNPDCAPSPSLWADTYLGLVPLPGTDEQAAPLQNAVGRVHGQQPAAEGWHPCYCVEMARPDGPYILALLVSPSPRRRGAYERLGFVQYGQLSRDTAEWQEYEEVWSRAERRTITIV
ncbi:hypothetical protein G7Y89_g10723 [Cudoniella acicularis]|uniref:Heterokaryon incompatibility domain-containing protein n=1 Tax=Cudoniella acicularis TaxID=354080 RepID=A0A8H4VYR1_9HELO|nr:hypothetical protein G7Y89_g10723 [Cudoniella acicularis]